MAPAGGALGPHALLRVCSTLRVSAVSHSSAAEQSCRTSCATGCMQVHTSAAMRWPHVAGQA